MPRPLFFGCGKAASFLLLNSLGECWERCFGARAAREVGSGEDSADHFSVDVGEAELPALETVGE